MTTLTTKRASPVSVPRKTPVTSVTLRVSTRDGMNLRALRLGAEIGRRVPLADLVDAAMTLVDRHADEVREILSAPLTNPEGTDLR
jgi:hypothetical protein